MGDHVWVLGHSSQYVTSHRDQLSLAILWWVGTVSTSQRVMMPCGCGVKAVWFVCGWQVKLCNPLVTHGPYLSTLEIGHYKALCSHLLYFTFLILSEYLPV